MVSFNHSTVRPGGVGGCSSPVAGSAGLKNARASRYRYISIVTSLLTMLTVLMAFSPFSLLGAPSSIVQEFPQEMMMMSSPMLGDAIPVWHVEDELSMQVTRDEGTLREIFKKQVEEQKAFCSKMGDEKMPRLYSVNLSSNGNASVAVLEKVDGIWSLNGFEEYSLYALQSSNNSGMADIVSHSLREYGQWEGGEIQSLIYKLDTFAESRGLSRSEVYFVDIGANIGTFSFAIAMMGFQVLAFEALQVNQQALHLSLCANPQLIESIAIFKTALGKERATCQMFSDPQNILDGAVGCGTSKKPPFPFLVWRQQLDIVRLDDVIGHDAMVRLTGKVGAVKMDTEGFEPWVIRGGYTFFNTTKPQYFVTELNPPPLKAATNTSSVAFIRQIQSLGYSLHNGSFDSPLLSKKRIRRMFSPKNEHLVNLYFTMDDTL